MDQCRMRPFYAMAAFLSKYSLERYATHRLLHWSLDIFRNPADIDLWSGGVSENHYLAPCWDPPLPVSLLHR